MATDGYIPNQSSVTKTPANRLNGAGANLKPNRLMEGQRHMETIIEHVPAATAFLLLYIGTFVGLAACIWSAPDDG